MNNIWIVDTPIGQLGIYSDDFQKEHSSYTSYHFNPTEGCIILFPSHLLHHVNPNKSNEDRISVAFNMSFQ